MDSDREPALREVGWYREIVQFSSLTGMRTFSLPFAKGENRDQRSNDFSNWKSKEVY